MKVAIIGAGASGLVSARHVVAEGMECEVLEMNSEVGGVWVYTDDIGKDKNGFPVYSAMYKGLVTNLPKELMGCIDFPIPEPEESYITQPDMLKFLNLFTDHFNLRHLIKFNRMVTEVRPIDSDKWQIKSLNKCTKQEIEGIYDGVMLCSGTFNEPNIPTLAGQEKFSGKILHSNECRSFEPFRDQKVLIIGAGPSGLDYVLHISPLAKKVVISHHAETTGNIENLPNVSVKPDVLRIINEKEVEFVDGSCDAFDTIILCTGYKYSYPYLHSSCGITIDNNFVQPLYKHIINIIKPTMCFIGVPFHNCHLMMFDLQAQFYCKSLNGSMQLPTPEIMRKETEEEMEMRWAKGYSKKKAHLIGFGQQDYFDDLISSAKLTTRVAPVIDKLWRVSLDNIFQDFLNFRKDKYKIVDNENFVKVQ